MTESSETHNWQSKQNWIKDVLSKSGTEFMEISKIRENGKQGAAKLPKKNGTESQNKMVYYQSTPLIVKTEQPSQAHFCATLNETVKTTSKMAHQNSIHQQNTIQNYNISPFVVDTQLQQHEVPQTSIIRNESSSQYLTSIKSELIPSSITLFAPSTSTPGNAELITLQNLKIGSAISTNGNVNTTSVGTPITTATVGHKPIVNKPQFKCEQCGMTFGSKSAHTSHTKSHAMNGDLSMIVGRGSSNAAGCITGQTNTIEVNEVGVPLGIPKTPQIRPNTSGAPGTDPYQCNVCQKTFAVPARLIRHYRTHTGERPFECEFCHKLFSVKENLQVHRRIHTKERPYKCDVCGRAFEHSGKLHRHMRIHTGERPHKCSVCEKTFIQSGQLVIHMRTHTGEKPYKCPVEGCGKGFTCSKQLKVHSRTHTGEKPYHCDICFRDFGYNHVLKLHRVQHYGSKCYKCTICDETFKSKKEMEAHIKGHANELPDEEEEEAVAAGVSGQKTSSSSGSGAETTSAPSSPQSPTTSSATTNKPKKIKQERKRTNSSVSHGVLLPSSPRSTHSPTSSQASVSCASVGSPVSSIPSPSMSVIFETDYNNDIGIASTSSNRQMTTPTLVVSTNNSQFSYGIEDMPTDLSVQQPSNYYRQQQHLPITYQNPDYHQQRQETSNSYMLHSSLSTTTTKSSTTELQEPQIHHHTLIEQPTINPALLEAASIVSRRALLESRTEDVTQAALQIMQLNRSQQKQQHQQQHLQQIHNQLQPIQHESATSSSQHHLLESDLPHYDDTREANELIEHYKRGELAKRYAPVPKFESSFLNNEIIVRQVEAAIAPLRSSTESPERSSSPESDSMMMADRDMMTLPLRKRKLYMKEGPANEATIENTSNTTTSGDISRGGTKVIRMSSVIQFAKAS